MRAVAPRARAGGTGGAGAGGAGTGTGGAALRRGSDDRPPHGDANGGDGRRRHTFLDFLGLGGGAADAAGGARPST